MIAESEGVKMDDGVSDKPHFAEGPNTDLMSGQVLPLILELSGGDMRKAITYMQTGQRLHQAQSKPTPLSKESSESTLLVLNSVEICD